MGEPQTVAIVWHSLFLALGAFCTLAGMFVDAPLIVRLMIVAAGLGCGMQSVRELARLI